MHNPYTKQELHYHRPVDRATADYAFLAVLAFGAAMVVAIVAGGWAYPPILVLSSTTVAFVYVYVGGYGFARAQRRRHLGLARSNGDLAAFVLIVAAWDLAVPFVLEGRPPLMAAVHTVVDVSAITAMALAWHAALDEPRSTAHAGA